MYVKAPTGKSKKELNALLFGRAARRNRTDPYEEKKYCGPGIKEVQAWWKQCQDWMAQFKQQGEPFVFNFKKLLKALSALGFTLIHGVHRWPDKVESYFHLDRAPHDNPLTYYTRVFLHQLRFPALRALGLPEADVLAIEHATRSALLNLPLLQALDFLHTQLLAGLCVAAPQRGLIKRDHLHDPTRRHPPPTSGDSPLQKKRSNTSSLQSSAVGLVSASRQICLLSLSNATPLRGQTVIPKATTETMSLASRQATYYN